MTTEQQAREALDALDDYARMANIAAIGPLKVLSDFITQAAEDKRRIEELERELVVNQRIADAVRGADAAFVHDDNEIVHTDDYDPKHYGNVLIIPRSVLEGE